MSSWSLWPRWELLFLRGWTGEQADRGLCYSRPPGASWSQTPHHQSDNRRHSHIPLSCNHYQHPPDLFLFFLCNENTTMPRLQFLHGKKFWAPVGLMSQNMLWNLSFSVREGNKILTDCSLWCSMIQCSSLSTMIETSVHFHSRLLTVVGYYLTCMLEFKKFEAAEKWVTDELFWNLTTTAEKTTDVSVRQHMAETSITPRLRYMLTPIKSIHKMQQHVTEQKTKFMY